MAKSSFTKPGAAAPSKPTAPAAKPTPGKPTPGAKPTPAKPTPAKPTPTPPPGVKTNVGAPKPSPRQQQAPPAPEPQEPEAPEEEETAAEEEGTGSELAVVDNAGDGVGIANLMTAPMGQLSGALDQYDFEIPFLKLAQSVGPLTEEHGFTAGDWVAANTVILWQEGCEEIEITFARALKQWVENLPYGSDDMPRIFNTPEEATAADLTLTWGPDNEAPGALPQVQALVFVKKPDGVTDEAGVFNLEGPDQALYAMLLWRISGVAYGRVVKKMTGALRTRLKDGLHTGTFKLTARKEKGKVNSYWVPILDPGENHTEEMVQFILENAGAE